MRAFLILNITVLLLAIALRANAARIKDIANVRGVRENQLIGYGLVVGLNGTGDGKAEFTSKSLGRMLDSIGLKLDSKELGSKNVAAVLVTATLPAFARAGNKLDITVNSIGEASSLEGGVLVQTPLRAANQQVYAVAQGSILVGGGDTQSMGGGSNKVHATVGRVPNGAIIERDLDVDFASQKMFRLTLHSPDFTTAARVAKTINLDLGGKYAAAKDSGTVDVIVPFSYEGNAVELMASIETLDVSPDRKAKVVVNEKTGTVVMGEGVRVSKVAISHGSLSLKVGGEAKKDKPGDRVAVIDGETSIGELVKAMNSLGVSPKDLITILQNIKAAGALQGELDIL